MCECVSAFMSMNCVHKCVMKLDAWCNFAPCNFDDHRFELQPGTALNNLERGWGVMIVELCEEELTVIAGGVAFIILENSRQFNRRVQEEKTALLEVHQPQIWPYSTPNMVHMNQLGSLLCSISFLLEGHSTNFTHEDNSDSVIKVNSFWALRHEH